MFTRQTLLKHKYTDNVTDSNSFLYFVKYTFSFGFSGGFEGNNKYAKKVLLRHGMRWPCSFHFRHVRNKIVFTLQVDFAMPEVAYARGNHHEFICFCEYLLWVKANEVNYLVP